MPAGILIIDKPVGITSRRVTDAVGRLLGTKKVGHVGTLDPLASGVLAVVAGAATRLIPFLEPSDKVYCAGVRLGVATDTQDTEGSPTDTGDWRAVTAAAVTAALAGLTGEIMQTPPMHSAVKQGGVPLYRLARRGVTVEREPRPALVRAITIESFVPPDLVLRVECGPGVYVRTLAHDLRLGCFAHLAALARLQSGPFTLEQAAALDTLTPESARARLIAPADCLPHLPAAVVDEARAYDLRQGRAVLLPAGAAEPGAVVRLLFDGGLLALARVEAAEAGVLARPVKVFAGDEP